MRTLPASVTLDELVQAGRVAVWQASGKWNGQGDFEAFASERVNWAFKDYLRKLKPGGRNGPAVEFVDVDDAHGLAADDDTAAECQRRQQFEETMSALPAKDRDAVARALAGKPGGPSAAKVVAMVEGKRNRTPDGFDPDSVPVLMNLPVPPLAEPKVSRFARLLDRMPAGSAVELGNLQAEALIRHSRTRGIKCVRRKKTATTMLVFREPTDKQLKGK
jgi:hypothetical protein